MDASIQKTQSRLSGSGYRVGNVQGRRANRDGARKERDQHPFELELEAEGEHTSQPDRKAEAMPTKQAADDRETGQSIDILG